MKIKFILITIFILNLSCNSKSQDNFENVETKKTQTFDSKKEVINDFEKNYIGAINKKINVAFHLKSVDGIVTGFYFYQSKGIDIKLKGKILNNKIVLNEYDYLNNKAAEINIIIKGENIFGEWINFKTKKTLKINLKETEKKITDLPNNIEGIYKNTSKEIGIEICNLTLKLTKSNGEYFYNLKSESRNLNGKISFSRNIEENETYIIFEGIEWADYQGDITNQDDENYVEKQLELPIGISGFFIENEITIQNYGNSMNYYIKLNDCEEKFIVLKK